MSYGTPRAVCEKRTDKSYGPRWAMCLPCAVHMFNDKNNHGKRGTAFERWAIEEVCSGWDDEGEDEKDFIRKVVNGKVTDNYKENGDVEVELLHEGQHNEQFVLDNFWCETCLKELYELCVDY